jgi:hypothetical protein
VKNGKLEYHALPFPERIKHIFPTPNEFTDINAVQFTEDKIYVPLPQSGNSKMLPQRAGIFLSMVCNSNTLCLTPLNLGDELEMNTVTNEFKAVTEKPESERTINLKNQTIFSLSMLNIKKRKPKEISDFYYMDNSIRSIETYISFIKVSAHSKELMSCQKKVALNEFIGNIENAGKQIFAHVMKGMM